MAQAHRTALQRLTQRALAAEAELAQANSRVIAAEARAAAAEERAAAMPGPSVDETVLEPVPAAPSAAPAVGGAAQVCLAYHSREGAEWISAALKSPLALTPSVGVKLSLCCDANGSEHIVAILTGLDAGVPDTIAEPPASGVAAAESAEIASLRAALDEAESRATLAERRVDMLQLELRAEKEQRSTFSWLSRSPVRSKEKYEKQLEISQELARQIEERDKVIAKLRGQRGH